MSTPTPRTDAVVYATEGTMEPSSEDRYQRMATHARQLERELEEAKAALENAKSAGQKFLDHYLELVRSGDAGNWDPENEGE